ncbi:MAG TPA: hypothetical protein VFR03_03280 [Thermoanaerobaculia bacterium]|nr:hypothetical protein [Thermoanaerobaculia bacterium]
MKSLGVASVSALLLLSLLTPRLDAQTPGASARGSLQFILEDELVKSVDFSAVNDEKGNTTGDLSFTDEAKIADTDDPEDPKAGDPPPQFYVKVALDGLTVEKNQALLSGTVLDSSHETYIGKWVQFVVEDNGTSLERPDRLTWTFCRPRTTGWIPSDAERASDDGAYLHWWATDAERDDDVGIPSVDLISKEDTGCPVRPLGLYPFADLLKQSGDIAVFQP